jgi:hypothetical protein
MRSRVVTLEAVGSWGGRLVEASPASEAGPEATTQPTTLTGVMPRISPLTAAMIEAFLDLPADQFKFPPG